MKLSRGRATGIVTWVVDKCPINPCIESNTRRNEGLAIIAVNL